MKHTSSTALQCQDAHLLGQQQIGHVLSSSAALAAQTLRQKARMHAAQAHAIMPSSTSSHTQTHTLAQTQAHRPGNFVHAMLQPALFPTQSNIHQPLEYESSPL